MKIPNSRKGNHKPQHFVSKNHSKEIRTSSRLEIRDWNQNEGKEEDPEVLNVMTRRDDDSFKSLLD